MKVIDLLNKIANGEEVPKKIKINEIIYEYQGDDYLYIDEYKHEYWLFSASYTDRFTWLESFLKTRVEIIEEEQDIEELKLKDGKIVGTWENGSNYCYTLSAPQTVLCNKINELIKEVNKQKNNEEVL